MRKKENKIAKRMFTVLELVSFSNMESASTECVTRMSNIFQEEKRSFFFKCFVNNNNNNKPNSIVWA